MHTSIQLDDESAARLEALARRTGQPKSVHIIKAINAYLDEAAEVEWAMNAAQEWEAAGKKSRPAKDLWAELE